MKRAYDYNDIVEDWDIVEKQYDYIRERKDIKSSKFFQYLPLNRLAFKEF